MLQLPCAGCSLQCRLFSSCGEWGLFSSCGAKASHCGGYFAAEHRLEGADLVAVVHGLVALRSVESARTRGRTPVLCTGWWILIHRATREVTYQVHIKKIY